MADEAPLRLASIVGVDVAGYSARTEADSSATARQVVAMRKRVADVAERHRGRIFNTAGDGLMLEFSSASDAVEAIYDLLDDRPAKEPEAHIGAHLGDVTTTENGDVLGHGVNVAARLMALAPAGRAVISQDLKAAAGSHANREMRALGEVALAKMHAKVFAFEIAPDAGARLSPVVNWRARGALIGVAAVAALAAAGLIFSFAGKRPDLTAAAPTPAKDRVSKESVTTTTETAPVSIAVLPFVNMSSDPEQEYFADGLTEEMLNWLANVEGLSVPGRTSSFQFKGKAKDLRVIGDALNVRYLLEGSVRRSGDSLRITAQLIEVETGFHRWSETYDRKLDDIFAVQDDLANRVVADLLGKIPGAGVANPAAVGDVAPNAHELYLEGRALWATRNSGAAFDKFRAAAAIDPNHALAQAYIAVVGAHASRNGLPLSEAFPDLDAIVDGAIASAAKARPQSADVLFAQGWVAEFRSPKQIGILADPVAIALYERAVRANPRHVEALHALSRRDLPLPRKIEILERILEIDGGLMAARTNLFAAYLAAGERDRAHALVRQTLTLLPDSPRAGPAALGKALGDLQLVGESVFADWDATERDQFSRLTRAALLADLGAVDEAQFLYEREQVEADSFFQEVRIYAPTLAGDVASQLRAAEAQYVTERPAPWSPWTFALSLIASDKPERAYEILLKRRPDFASKPAPVYNGWGEIPDIELLTAAHALALAGRRDEARALWNAELAFLGDEPVSGWQEGLGLALAHGALGNKAAAIVSFNAAYQAGFRYPWSYDCDGCVHDGFYADHGLFAELLRTPEIVAVVDRIKTENAKALEEFNKKYGVVDRVRAMMEAEAH